MRLSVIIPSRNRGSTLVDMLRSLEHQTLPHDTYEIVVVDNGSTDDTPTVIAQAQRTLKNLSYHRELEPGLHAGRHRGLREAKSDLLTFADDDIVATPTWLESVVDAFSDPAIDLVGGNNFPRFLEQPPLWLTRLWDRPNLGGRAIPALSVLELPGARRLYNPLYVWGCNFSIRKSALLAAGGFHPDSLPQALMRFRGDGETHVSRYLSQHRRKCLFHPGASVHHNITPERMKISYFRKRAFNQGISDSYTALRHDQLQKKSKFDRVAAIGATARRIRRLSGRLRSLGTRDHALRSLFNESAAGYQEGFAFHQHAFATDPEVREWVLKPTYLSE